MSLHNASDNPNYVNIVKSFSPYSTLKDLKFFEADPNDPSDLIEKLFTPHNNNSFTTPIPLISNPNRRSGKNLDFTGCVQPIIFEFDHCDLEFQEKRIEFLKDELKTPMAMKLRVDFLGSLTTVIASLYFPSNENSSSSMVLIKESRSMTSAPSSILLKYSPF